ncbi:MAG: cytochrome c [Nitrospirales bacterium]|nr:MAG: cytochrome c [Nitrospirales bacterium]
MKLSLVIGVSLLLGLNLLWNDGLSPVALAQEASDSEKETSWVKEITKVFVPSEQCKQCHDRHYEEWKGMREQTPDLKTFGRVDGALLHGTALKSHVFKTVLGLWLQTEPTQQERVECLACHAPAVTVFPQHTDRIIQQVMAGGKHVTIEGISCSSCHLINDIQENAKAHPTFKINPEQKFYGPYANPEENLVHDSQQADIYKEVKFCTACHFSKVKDVTRPDLPGEILKGTICQDCHMERSTGSSTSKRGSLTRPIGRHWFQGIVIPGIMLSNRNLQAEWFPRVDIEASKKDGSVEGTVLVRNGSLPHMFPGGDPVLKQFFVKVTVKDTQGNIIDEKQERYGRTFEELLRGPIPQPLVNGGITRRVPFALQIPEGLESVLVEASLSYALIPEPSPALKDQYLKTLKNDTERQAAEKVITDYSSTRLLTFRTMTL